MKKTLLYLALLLIGIGIGYSLNSYMDKPVDIEKETQKPTEKIYIEKVKKEVIRDTIEVEKIVTVPVIKDTASPADTLHDADTLSKEKENEEVIISPNTEKEEVIITEELVAQRIIPIQLSAIDSTDVSAMLDLKTAAFADEITVEFWKSPLNITGYELTRNKLKLFGFNPSESISLRLDNNEEQLLLDTESMSIVLHKSKQFKTLKLK